MTNVTINNDQELFVIGNEQGYSCMGFDNVYIQASELARRLYPDPHERPLIFEGEKGHMRQYQQYQELINQAAAQGGFQDTWFHPHTPLEVRNILERYRKSGHPLRLYLGDPETGRDWLEEHDVFGRIGRSTGIMKIPLLMEDGIGGGGILDHCLVKLQDGRSGRLLWKHPTYHLPTLKIDGTTVLADDKVRARFKRVGQAAVLVAFLSGEIFDRGPRNAMRTVH